MRIDLLKSTILIILIILINSCASKNVLINREIESEKRFVNKDLNNTNFNLLDGSYLNNKDSLYFSLWEQLVLKTKNKEKVINNSTNAIVNIKFINETLLQLTLLIDGKQVKQKIIKGEFINGMFLFKKQKQGLGLIPLIWVYREQYSIIGINADQNLIIGTDTSGAFLIGVIPIMGPPGSGYWEPKIFEKLK